MNSMIHRMTENARAARQSRIRALTARVEALGGVNLSQGVCPLPPRRELLKAARAAAVTGPHIYTASHGLPRLRDAVANFYKEHRGLAITDRNTIITAGATAAFETACKAFLSHADSAIVFEPAYQYHLRQIADRQARVIPVPLKAPDWRLKPEVLQAAGDSSTKILVLNNPNNPTGRVFSREELDVVASYCIERDLVAVVDEVYEHILCERIEHISLASLPGMQDRTITISSASKSLFVTGWRIGWLVAPEAAIGPLSVKFDDSYICAPAPLQQAVGEVMEKIGDWMPALLPLFGSKRDRLAEALKRCGFNFQLPEGAYYIMAHYPSSWPKNDVAACERLIQVAKVAAVPGNTFYTQNQHTGMLRFCFAIPDAELDRAANLLADAFGVR
jgi:aminotransferase